jgi:Protein of unknown function (DUF3048) N-terminal domain/Protein of unknown function (DUF3048) C-terminal domain
MRSRLLLSFVALSVVAVAACGGGGTATAKKKAAPTTTTTQGPPVAPLTGQPDPGGQTLTKPALSVKIENTPEARPQTGLDQADVVYEEVTEAGITRFIAVFNSNIPPIVGPVRSVRIMDPDLLAPLGGIFVYSGGIQETVSALGQTPGVNAVVDTGSDPALFRDHTKVAPHNLYGHTDQLLARGGKPIPITPLFKYVPTGTQFTGNPVQTFTVKYDPLYAPSYAWDAASGTWKRSIGLAPFMDSDGKQVAPNNVVVQFVGCCLPSPEGGNFQTVGNGAAWFFSNGQLVEGKWSRTDRSQATQYTDINGQPMALTPGKTWVELLPSLGYAPLQVVVTPSASAAAPTPTTAPPTTTTTRKKH